MEELLQALCSVRFWFRTWDVGFVLDDGVLLDSSGRGYLVPFGRPEPPDLLLVRWAAPGGLVAQDMLPEVRAASELGHPGLDLFEDTRERRSDAGYYAFAVLRFARCSDPSHPSPGEARVLCPRCLEPIRAAYAEGEERSRARDAVRMLRDMALDAPGRFRW